MTPGFRKLVFLLAAAASISASQWVHAQASTPPPDKARIVFVRLAQNLGKASTAELYEVVDRKPRFLARLEQGDKLVLDVPPGEKEFMTVGYTPQQVGGPTMAADLLFADVRAGATYASVLRFHYGTGGFIPEPVRADRRYKPDSPQVLQAIAAAREVKLSPQERERMARERSEERLQMHFDRMSAAYDKKGPDRLKERTLRPDDVLK